MNHTRETIGIIVLFVALTGGLLSPGLDGAEIRLKDTIIQSTKSLVTLADIADVLPNQGENVDNLRQTILFPAPVNGESRTLNQAQIRTLLSQLGINSLEHILTGAKQIAVTGANEMSYAAPVQDKFVVQADYRTATQSPALGLRPAAHIAVAAPPVAGITDELAKLLENQVLKALNVYLNFTNRIERSWEITLKLTPEQIKLFASNGQITEITGGQIPFTGIQQFHIRMQNNVTVTVDAEVKLPTEVVIVRRALPKGHIINESDVMLQRIDKIKGEDFFVDVNSVIGKETVKAVRELSILTQSVVQMPLLVRRGDIITVKAMCGGIVVRTEANALQDGVEGDTITVAKIDLSPKRGKKDEPVTYLARVSAPKTVEVFVK